MAAKLLDQLEQRRFYAGRTLISAVIVGICRVLLDSHVYGVQPQFVDIVQAVGWYIYLALGLSVATAFAQRVDWRRMAHPVSYALFLGLLPPLLAVVAGEHPPGAPRSFLTSELSLVFRGPAVPVAETAVIWGAVALCGVYPLLQGRNLLAACSSLVGAYLVFAAALLWVPWCFALLDPSAVFVGAAGLPGFQSAMLLQLALLLYLLADQARIGPSLRRVEHALPWFFAVLAGAAIKQVITAEALVLACWVFVMHMAIVVTNDVYDRKQDAGYRPTGTIGSEEVYLINALILGFVFALASVSAGLSALGALYFFATLSYHHDSTRLKRICPVNYKTEGFVGAAAFAMGIVAVAVGGSFTRPELWLTFLVFGGFSLVSMFKDYKDIDSDRDARINTVYVVMQRRGWSAVQIHRLVVIVVTTCLLVPGVYLLLHADTVFMSIPVVAMAMVVGTSLARTNDPTRCVRRSLWLLNGYLLVLVATLASGRY